MIKHVLPLLTTTTLSFLPIIAYAQTYQPSNRIPQADNIQIGTQVKNLGNNNFGIEGGLKRGQNLFHSFTDFSIPTGGSANFNNPVGNQSIISRVTGNLFSDINGLLNTNGANFLLINPHGVVFGAGAKLDVGKAFVTSTASGVDFVDPQGRNYNFGTNKAGDALLLTIDPNVAFNPARLIINASIPGSRGIENYGTLTTNNKSQYIGLIGGNVNLNGGKIIAPGAKVELGGLQQSGSISFSLNNGVQFPANVERGNVSVGSIETSPSIIDVRSSGDGSLSIFAKDITIQGTGTRIRAGIATGLGNSTAIAGDIKLDATGNIRLADTAFIVNIVYPGAEGKGGGIEIKTGNLSVTNGAQLVTNTRGKGDAGSIKIIATGNVSFDGIQDGFGTAAFSSVGRGGEGKAGGIEITTGSLSVTNGAQLIASTLGKGDAGNIKITATGNVSFDGNKDGFLSAALSTVEPGAMGKGGEIEIAARNLRVTNGGGLAASTDGQGDAGSIKITAAENVLFDGESVALSTLTQNAEGKGGGIEIMTGNLSVTNGAELSATTFGKGDAGNIKITATGNVSFDGSQDDSGNSTALSAVAPGAEGKGGGIEIKTGNLSVTNGAQLIASTLGKGDAGNIKITATGNVSFDGSKNSFSSAAISQVEEGAVGKGGGIEIKTGTLSITNGAGLSASTGGQGDAGDIFLNSNTIRLNKGEISSKSTSSTGGNINIITNDFLLLQNSSFIATDSKSTDKNGNGGNITIGSPLIIALPGNNDITANANRGNGGNVKIDTQGLFGIQYRPIGTAFTNDITASSTFGQSGIVQINTPGTDPGKDKGELSAATNDASKQVSQACSASQRDHKFYMTGRGGLPPNASEPQESDALWSDARAEEAQAATTASLPPKYAPPAIGLVLEPNGRARLIAAQTAGGLTETKVVCPNK
ncbi:filamentous hemagglutinin N-terminal domain-containing protein [Chamaesiphon sp. VAR_48_metabat_135_sub]|uniref:two-partner secretion domain-containing protein n=1 Tax=Chamaesiphon sp. VAR_48_metabat_135_sub TaxID=2964699 RepID=UPI00286D5AE5|nr:filamentous hemagglutinin N-terminal domain-containing protein [Chamaesiphon sp. VAR_48_metabat_135_sub]